MESRTIKSLKNVQVATVFYFINLILQFFSRKIFIEYLGSEVLGLNTTAQNLLGFLNIAELGIGTAVAYNLYKPIYENNRNAIKDIVSIQGWLYSRIAIFVIIGALVLMAFFPRIFAKADIPLWYAYGTFSVLLLGALLGYFVNYKQIVLSADQKEYKITYSFQGVKVFKIICQILAVRFLEHGYVWWMALEAVASIVTAYVLDWCVRKEYPWLKTDKKAARCVRKDYPNIILKTKQVFFHKIGYFVLSQTTPLVIYGFASLTLVAIYGNYMLIVTAVTMLMNALLNGIGAGVGNLVAEGNKAQIKKVYWELTSARIWIALIFCFSFYMLGNSFMELWVGKNYILPKVPFIFIIATAFIQMTRTNDIFISAYGLYHDIWAPIAEATLNLGLSIVLGHFFGLSGILFGVLISLLIIICFWKPYFLYSRGFKESIREYVWRYGKLIFLSLSSFIASYYLTRSLLHDITNYWQWIWKGTIIILVISILSFIALYLFDKHFKSFVNRIKDFAIFSSRN